MKTYKGFNKDLTCRGFQYEIGKEYSIDGNIKVCERGFHACESPLEVFDYYNMIDSRFCEVEQSGKIEQESASTKVCSSKIKIVAELKLSDMIKLGVEWIKDKTINKQPSSESDGVTAQIGSSGVYAKIGSSGVYAKIGSSGVYAKIGSSGVSAQIGSSGDSAQIISEGQDSVVCCAGHGAKVMAKVGSWITLAEWKYDYTKSRQVPVCVKTEYVDGQKIKEYTFYRLVNGEFVEC